MRIYYLNKRYGRTALLVFACVISSPNDDQRNSQVRNFLGFGALEIAQRSNVILFLFHTCLTSSLRAATAPRLARTHERK
jgi:hypothetical protein